MIKPVVRGPLPQSCDSTQLDFIAEQCSQTDPQPLHLQPAAASFYTWVPAVGFAQGECDRCPLLSNNGNTFSSDPRSLSLSL